MLPTNICAVAKPHPLREKKWVMSPHNNRQKILKLKTTKTNIKILFMYEFKFSKMEECGRAYEGEKNDFIK